jgi:glucose uptake protein GlcU
MNIPDPQHFFDIILHIVELQPCCSSIELMHVFVSGLVWDFHQHAALWVERPR